MKIKSFSYKFLNLNNLINELNNEQVYILGIENDNKSVDWFKKQMSNSKIEYYIYDFYLSLKSLIILILKLSIS